MEELALKPLNPIDASYSNQVVDSVVRSELVYRYGEDISKWAVILPFTLNHTTTGSILALFDGDPNTVYALGNAVAGSHTTTMIFDFGKLLQIRGIIFSFHENQNATTASYYSEDGINYTLIDSSTNSTGSDVYYDHVAAISRIKSFKIVVTTVGIGSSSSLHQLMFIV